MVSTENVPRLFFLEIIRININEMSVSVKNKNTTHMDVDNWDDAEGR